MKKLNGLDKTLIFIAILDTLFVISMIIIFCIFQSTPDILIGAVFGATFGECGCCSYIWKIKREKEIENGKDNIRDSGINTDSDIYVNSETLHSEQDRDE